MTWERKHTFILEAHIVKSIELEKLSKKVQRCIMLIWKQAYIAL